MAFSFLCGKRNAASGPLSSIESRAILSLSSVGGTEARRGSGFFLSKNGCVSTTNHLVFLSQSYDFLARAASDQEHGSSARVVKTVPELDFALLKVHPGEQSFAALPLPNDSIAPLLNEVLSVPWRDEKGNIHIHAGVVRREKLSAIVIEGWFVFAHEIQGGGMLGMSGAPVINKRAQTVGQFVARSLDNETGYFVPLPQKAVREKIEEYKQCR